MPRIDDYKQARALAVQKLSDGTFEDIADRAGFQIIDEADPSLRIPFLNRSYRVGYPDFSFTDEADSELEVPIQEQIIILHYMAGGSAPPLSNEWVAYREIPGASFYFSAFVKRAIDPLKKVFGRNVSGLQAAAKQLKGKAIDVGDAGLEFQIFPRVPLQLILWEGDDEFEPEANILFDASIGDLLSTDQLCRRSCAHRGAGGRLSSTCD